MAKHVTESATLKRLTQQFSGYDRSPFIEHLAQACGCLPSPDELRKFARKRPAQFAQYIATFAKLAGFTERTESVNLTVITSLQSLSDIELEEELRKLNAQLDMQRTQSNHAGAGADVIDITPSTPPKLTSE